MKLRRLTLSGFKTFARRNDVIFDRGITAIVGPNGSGKSNIVDGIRWALGETNARELRGAKMEEVIYSGGAKRARMNVAEVEICIDNSEGRIPVEDAEVSVVRRVERGGDSEYRLNGDRVRLRDIERTLGATGLTQTGYSVVAQNDIDAIIQATPAQRRSLVEQAAGVRSLRAAAEDALHRVEQAEITLRRLDDLLDDAEPRLAELAQQAELALEQRELTERLSELRGSLAREEWRAARGQLKQAKRRLDAALTRAETANTAQAEFDERNAAQHQNLDSARRRYAAAAAELEAARLAAERAAGEARRFVDRQVAAVLQRAIARNESNGADSDVTTATEAMAHIDPASSDATAIEEQLEAARLRLADIEERVDGAEAHVVQLQTEVEERASAQLSAQAAQQEAVARRVLVAENATALDGEAAALREAIAHAEQGLSQASETLASHQLTFDLAQEESEAAAQRLESLRAQLSDAENSLRTLREELRVAVTYAAQLKGQKAGLLGGEGAIAQAVSSGSLAARRLVDCFRVDNDQWQLAIEAALEDVLGGFVVDDVDAAAVHFTGEGVREQLVARNLPVRERQATPEGVRNPMDVITLLDDSIAGALSAALSDVWLAGDSATALRIARQHNCRVVLGNGQVASALGIRGGKVGGALEIAADERAAQTHAETVVVAEQNAAATVQALRQQIAAEEGNVGAATASLHVAEIATAEHNAAVTSAQRQLQAQQQRLTEIVAQQAMRARELEALDATVSACATASQQASAAIDEARQRLESQRHSAQSAKEQIEPAMQAWRDAEARAVEARFVQADFERRFHAADEQLVNARRRQLHAQLRLLTTESEAITAWVRKRQARRQLGSGNANVDAQAAALAAAQPVLEEAERAMAVVEAERSEIAIAVARAADESEAAAAEVEVANARVAELAEVVRDDGEDEGPEPDAQAAEKAEREIVRLERRIAQLGPVNGLAPEQHEVLALRVGTLRTSRDDIASACNDIRFVSHWLTQEIETRFEAVFGAVSVHFQELFAELFPGGKATLRLEPIAVAAPTDEGAAEGEQTDDVSRRPKLAGVEILAQPAGKRLQPLSLLSGGERALTALAVILALQQVNAAPFYVFDEIDAPLDDQNVVRLTRLLKRLSEHQQFIVVTHNHATMAAADVLYGVTIDADGVSSTLSVRLATAQEMTEVEVTGRVEKSAEKPVATAV